MKEMKTGVALRVEAGDDRMTVEVTRSGVFFEREHGGIFQIGLGRFTVVTSQEVDVLYALNKPYFGLTHTESGEVIERLRIKSDWLKEAFVEGVLSASGQALAVISLDHFEQVFPEVMSGQAGTPPWAVGAEGNPAVLPTDDGDPMQAYVVMRSEGDRLPGDRHRIEKSDIEAATRMKAGLIVLKELGLERGIEPLYFRFKTQDLLEKMGDSLCVLAELDGHLV